METWLYFIFGILLVVVIIPLLDALMVLIATLVELLKYKMSVKIAKYNSEIEKMGETEFEEKTPAIGFIYPQDYTEEEEEE